VGGVGYPHTHFFLWFYFLFSFFFTFFFNHPSLQIPFFCFSFSLPFFGWGRGWFSVGVSTLLYFFVPAPYLTPLGGDLTPPPHHPKPTTPPLLRGSSGLLGVGAFWVAVYSPNDHQSPPPPAPPQPPHLFHVSDTPVWGPALHVPSLSARRLHVSPSSIDLSQTLRHFSPSSLGVLYMCWCAVQLNSCPPVFHLSSRSIPLLFDSTPCPVRFFFQLPRASYT